MTLDTNVLEEIRPNTVISEKDTKNAKTTKFQKLENLDEIQIVKFEHNVIPVES